MKTLISLGMAAFVFGFVFSAGLAAGVKEIEMKLMKEGWVKLTTKELKALKDVTASDDYGWAEYIDPSGAKIVTQAMSGNIDKGRRKITADGQFCHYYEGAAKAFCWFLWKRGKDYRSVRSGSEEYELGGWQFTIKPGNTENL